MSKKELDKLVVRANALQTELFDKTGELNHIFRKLGMRNRVTVTIVKLASLEVK